MPVRSPDSNLHFALQDQLGKIRTTGNVFFVSSTDSSSSDTDGRSGRDPDNPVATIDFAVSLCTANNGDFIVVMPNHAETLTAAAQLVLDIAGVHVLGLGTGTSQPTITMGTDTGVDVDIDAANVTVENIHFVANLPDIVECLDVNATDFTCRGCRFTDTSGSLNFLVCIQDAAAAASDRIIVEGCRAYGLDPTNTHFINLAGTGNGHIIRDNVLMGTWATMCIGGAGVVTQILVDNNKILNEIATGNTCINLAATATGVVSRNMCGGGHASDGISVGTCVSCENYYEDHDSATSGILEPAA